MNQATKEKVADEERGSLGVQVLDIDAATAEQYQMPEGVYIRGFTEGGNAEEAGLRQGYIITGINGTKVSTAEKLQNQLSYCKAGETVTLTVQYPDNSGSYAEKEVEVTLTNTSGR